MPHDTSSSSLFGRISARSSFVSHKDVKVTVQLLNDTDSVANEFKRSQPAQAILDYICEVKGIKERDYLGLRYQDHSKHRYWVDLSRPISHITKTYKVDTLNLRLRFRFYPEDPLHLREASSRYLLCVQLQRDLVHGRLHCPHLKAAELGGLILQAQLGDFDASVHTDNYVSQYTLVINQSVRSEQRIAEFHQSFRGLSTEQAESSFLRLASSLDTYGFDPYVVKDPLSGSDAYVGVNYRGIIIFQNNQKVHNIRWSDLSKVDYLGRELRIIPKDSYCPPSVNADGVALNITNIPHKDKKSRLVLKFNCPSGHFAKHLWNHVLSQQAFFNEQSALMIKPKFSKPRIPLLSRGSTFRYPSQRVLREIESTVDAQPARDASANGERVEGADNETVDERNKENGGTTVDGQARPAPSVPQFIRYELPRHSPRPLQPWLTPGSSSDCPLPSSAPSIDVLLSSNRSQTLPHRKPTSLFHNNNTMEKDGIDRNSSGPPTTSPILFDQTASSDPAPSSQQAPPTPSDGLSQATNGTLNSTSFTVHLVKYERSPAPSPVPAPLMTSSSPGDSPAPLLDEPLHTSTPLFNRNETKVKENGLVSNGNDVHPMTSSSVEAPPTSGGGRLTNTFFASFLVLLLLLSLLIAVFERNDGHDWIESSPFLSSLRHSYYEPARHFALQQYNKLFR